VCVFVNVQVLRDKRGSYSAQMIATSASVPQHSTCISALSACAIAVLFNGFASPCMLGQLLRIAATHKVDVPHVGVAVVLRGGAVDAGTARLEPFSIHGQVQKVESTVVCRTREALRHDLDVLGKLLAGLQGIQHCPHDAVVGAREVHVRKAVQGALHVEVLGGTVLGRELLHWVLHLRDVGGCVQLLGERTVGVHCLQAHHSQGGDELLHIIELRKGDGPPPVRPLRTV